MFIKLTRMTNDRACGAKEDNWKPTGEIVYVRPERIEVLVWNPTSKNTVVTMASGETEIVAESYDEINKLVELSWAGGGRL